MKKILSLFIALFLSAGCAQKITNDNDRSNNTKLINQKTLALASFQRRNFKRAIEEIEVAQKMDDKDPEVYLIKGLIYFALEDFVKTEELYIYALKLDDKYSEANFNLCVLYINQKKYDQAILYCSKSAEDRLYKSRYKAYTIIGVGYFNKGDREKAKEYFDKSLSIEPKFFYTHNELGKLHVSYGNLNEAVYEFKQAIESNPNYVESQYNIAKTYSSLKDVYNACNSFLRVLELSPNSDYGFTARNYVNSFCIDIDKNN
jgi:superkiller protein 3